MDARISEDVPTAKEATDCLLRVMRHVNSQMFKLYGNKVMTGPFTGMMIPEAPPWLDGNASVKLVGVYEHELHSALGHAVWRGAKVVVNVGCAEGYYAIGMARAGLKVIAFDIYEDSRLVCADYAEMNGVEVDLRDGARAPEELRLIEVIGHRLYIIDVEGAEEDLIDLERCPELVNSDLIIECHDFMKPGVSSRVADRLWETHRVEVVRPRLPDMRFLEKSPSAMGVLGVVEKRPMPSSWLVCWANRKAGPPSAIGD